MGVYIAGLDLGTSSVKALIMDQTGKVLAVSHRDYDVITARMSYAEQDPGAWWAASRFVLSDALSRSGIAPDKLQGIGFSGQMHGLVALDRENRPVCPAIIWMDQRSAEEAAEIKEAAGELLTGDLLNQPAAGMMICTLLWLMKHEPDVYERIDKVMLPKDYIRFCLTGAFGSDYADSSATLAFSVKTKKWCRELLKRVGLRDDFLPEVHASSEIAGNVSAQASRETGLSVRTKTVYGGGDSSVQLVGNAVIEEGIVSCNIGTASQLAAVVNTPVYDKQMRLQTWCHAVPDKWYVQGGTLNGGSTLSWLKKKVLKDNRTFAELDAEASLAAAGSEGLIFIPFLAGERTPFMDPYAKGVYFGLGMKHEQKHLIRATMEGVMYNLKECLRVLDELGIRRDKVISSGGAAKGNTWKQIQADVLEMPIYTTATEEEACQGAAILAAIGVGIFKDAEEACGAVVRMRPGCTEPIRENVLRYREQQEIFRELYYSVRDLYPRLKA